MDNTTPYLTANTASYKTNILTLPNAARIDLDTGEVTMLTPNPNDAANAFWAAVQQMFAR